ncbi:MAG: hypothetical protein ACI8WB_005843 [Phenylobacterium sp.]
MEKGFKQLIKVKEKGFNQILSDFIKQGTLSLKREELNHLIELISMVLTQGLNYYVMKGDDIDDSTVIYRGLGSIFFALSPYLDIEEQQKLDLQQAISDGTLAQSE